MKRTRSWMAGGGSALFVAVVAAVAIADWDSIGNADIDLNGWIALGLGVATTLALGFGLMSLVFISNRRGYDEPPRGEQ